MGMAGLGWFLLGLVGLGFASCLAWWDYVLGYLCDVDEDVVGVEDSGVDGAGVDAGDGEPPLALLSGYGLV